MGAVSIFHIKGLDGIKPRIVRCPVKPCKYKNLDKNRMIGHLCTHHNKSELIEALIFILESGYAYIQDHILEA